MLLNRKHVAIIDPGVKKAELQAFNNMVEMSALPLSYHLPALMGPASLKGEGKGLSGIVIMGSASSVNDNLPWQIALQEWSEPLMKAGIPTFGICFGHQFIAHVFGGKVEKMGDGKRHLGFREIDFSPNRLWKEQSIKGSLFVTHEETVTHLPSELACVGKSKAVAHDAFAHKTLPIWSVQAHPEAMPDFANRETFKLENPAQLEFGHNLVRRFLNFCAGKGE